MQRILVLNPKGGSGKTTVATNLASYFATLGDHPLLMDNDPQGSSTRWLKKRTPQQPFIHGIAAFERNTRMTRSFQLRVPPDAAHVVVDTPAAVMAHEMPEFTKNSDAILVPVLPSDIDIHTCSRCIADLLLIAKVRRDENRIGVIANRVKRNTVIYQSLMRFLETLRIPVVATLRDSQNYVRAAEQGVGLHEMKRHLVAQDLEDWESLLGWLRAKESLEPPSDGASALAETA
ncbi:MAG TPA: AAA family ATPase [Steroidobacteraceae bacterium]|jgi:chromosome partitioning protein|nr:AAA family ATPase [Steroidobacteraceae bacterium]